jgi:hypothetical protein
MSTFLFFLFLLALLFCVFLLTDGYGKVDELDLPKNKATELLKAHDGDAVKAMAAFVQVKF